MPHRYVVTPAWQQTAAEQRTPAHMTGTVGSAGPLGAGGVSGHHRWDTTFFREWM